MDPDPHVERIADLLRRGIAAVKEGQRDRARDLLMHVVEQDEENISAWMWLSGVVDDLEDREICMENVLTLDPDNEVARRGLAWVRAERQKRGPQIPQAAGPPATPPSVTADCARRGGAPCPPRPGVSKTAWRQTWTAGVPCSPRPGPPAKEPWDHPTDPLLCPYCASPTQEDDRRCPMCGGDLWIQVRRREEPSWWLWNVVVIQLALTVLLAVLPLVILTFVAYQVIGELNPFPLLPVYMGLSSDVAPQVASAALERVPRLYVLAVAGLALFSLIMLIATYLRWKPVFYTLLGQFALLLAGSIVAAALGQYYGIICGGAGSLVSLVMLFIVLQLEDDFLSDSRRIYYGIGGKVKSGMAMLAQGRSYARQKMWALAVLYLRAAVGRAPEQVAGHVELARAYIHLGRHNLAGRALQEARRSHPDDPQVIELTALLNGQRAAQEGRTPRKELT
jgi:tetratricopeptide (TPR) repeat protein